MKTSGINTISKVLASLINGQSSKKSSSCTTSCCLDVSNSVEHKKPVDLETVKHENQTAVCGLTEAKLAERKNELQKEVFSNVTGSTEIESGFIFSFPYEEKFLLNMTEYIISEKKCCPFFNFEIKLHQTNTILLQITGPLETKAILELFLAEIN